MMLSITLMPLNSAEVLEGARDALLGDRRRFIEALALAAEGDRALLRM